MTRGIPITAANDVIMYITLRCMHQLLDLVVLLSERGMNFGWLTLPVIVFGDEIGSGRGETASPGSGLNRCAITRGPVRRN